MLTSMCTTPIPYLLLCCCCCRFSLQLHWQQGLILFLLYSAELWGTVFVASGICCRLFHGFQRFPHPNPRTFEHTSVNGKESLSDVIKQRIFKWEDYSGLLGRSHLISKVFMKGRIFEDRSRERLENSTASCGDRERRSCEAGNENTCSLESSKIEETGSYLELLEKIALSTSF